jgi:hypothetical protein
MQKNLEDAELSGSTHPQKIELEEEQKLAKSSSHRGRLIVFREDQIDYPKPQSVLE